MEIVYDESGTRVLMRKDDGTEVDLLKLEGALVLAQKSREHNRGRVVVLEDKLERIRNILAEGGERLYTAAEVGDAQASEAELVAAPLRRQVQEYDRDRHTERDRADKAQARVAELEAALARSIGRENDLETRAAEKAAEHRTSLAARDSLLRAATTRVQAAREILSATAVGRARDEIVTSKGAILADAIGNALRALEG
jgi:hypothetical protein